MTTKPTTARLLSLCCLALALSGEAVEAQETSPALDSGIDVVLKGFEHCVRESAQIPQPLRNVDLGVHQILDRFLGRSMRVFPETLAWAWFQAFREPRYGRIVEELDHNIADEEEWGKRLGEAQKDMDYLDRLINIDNEIALVRQLDAGLNAEKREGACGRVLANLLIKVAEQRDRVQSWLRFVRFHVRKEKGLRVSEEHRRQAESAGEALQRREDALEKYRR